MSYTGIMVGAAAAPGAVAALGDTAGRAMDGVGAGPAPNRAGVGAAVGAAGAPGGAAGRELPMGAGGPAGRAGVAGGGAVAGFMVRRSRRARAAARVPKRGPEWRRRAGLDAVAP